MVGIMQSVIWMWPIEVTLMVVDGRLDKEYAVYPFNIHDNDNNNINNNNKKKIIRNTISI